MEGRTHLVHALPGRLPPGPGPLEGDVPDLRGDDVVQRDLEVPAAAGSPLNESLTAIADIVSG